jgi:hypothetical protein
MLFGEDPQQGEAQEPPSLMGQYLKSISQIAVEMNGGKPGSAGQGTGNRTQNSELRIQKSEVRSPQSVVATKKAPERSSFNHAEPAAADPKHPSVSQLVEEGPRTLPEQLPIGEALKIPTPRLLTKEARSSTQQEEKSVAPASAQAPDEKLAPVVPAWAVPRPGAKKPAPPSAPAVVKQEAIQRPDEAAIKSGKTIAFGPAKSTDPISSAAPQPPAIQPLRIELGGPQAASPAAISIAPQPLATPSASPPPLPPRHPPAGTQVLPVEK